MKFKDFPQAVINENVDYTVKEITSVIKRYGPRESGNKNCLATQKHIDKEMKPFCDETGFESYKMAPKAFLHFTKTVSVAVFLSIFVCLILAYTGVFDGIGKSDFFLAQCITGGVILVGLIITALEFLFYKQFCDVFYKKIEANNYYAVRKPKNEVKRRIIISGHCDSAYQWRHIYYGKKLPLMGICMGGTIGGAIISVIIALITIIANFVDMGAFGDFMLNYSYYFHIITGLFMITLFLFVDFKTISPGANDNLTGTYAAVCALRMLDMAGVEFENTEVVAMITDGEEAGLRGCKQWAKNHKDEYMNQGVETAVLCVDTLTDLEYLNVYSRDMTGTVKHDEKFSQLVMDSAIEAGHDDLKFANVFFGASDAAAFSQEGITATCLAAMDPAPADYYHNIRDSYDRLVPDAIKAGYEVILSTIFNFDEKGLK
ncbi:M28 family metallopeptidase [uncultured Eubacterium sp.]|uniref:M28 family metallopeptidase n=1 Tax=uncultured Eubacterium sp. TaxID=165185 RepID=UPI0015AF6AF7|nr:M20/M25/M40 family metallo-hydrolase [uncultured Eubacterium sp.]